ncbi:11997_t:CDS:2 [Acaulospora morrowiae]|uniref:11997_t:CDS:1 n=1 Tax=Acaulospora morrowiae TaxID=94023 RepID=A0A9N9DIG3_9GLOM|nr:11997_t:CDS:2 [Acaulospora morrowiae]
MKRKFDDAFELVGEDNSVLDTHSKLLSGSNDFLLEIEQDDTFALRDREETCKILDKYNESPLYFNKLLDLEPGDASLGKREEVHRMLGKYEESLHELNRLLEIDPENAALLRSRGETYKMLDKYYESLSDLNKSLEVDPNHASALRSRGAIYGMLNMYDESLHDLNKSLELEQNDASALRNRGVVYRMLGKYNESLLDLDRSLKIEPNDASTLRNRGVVYSILGKYNESLLDFDRSLEIEPDNAFALRNRGVTYTMLGKYKESLSDLNRSLEVEPDNPFASKNKEEIHKISSKYDKLISDCKELSKKQNVIHGRFSSEEDKKLLEYINKHGIGRWQDVAGHVGTRNEKQCRERYFGHLAPEVNKSPFTENEIKKIYELREEGYKWAEISRRLGNGRTPNNIKNIWNQKLSKSPGGRESKKIKGDKLSVESTIGAQSLLTFSGRELDCPSVFLNDERLTNELPSMQLIPGLPKYHSPLKPLEGITYNKQLNIQLPPIISYMQMFQQ